MYLVTQDSGFIRLGSSQAEFDILIPDSLPGLLVYTAFCLLWLKIQVVSRMQKRGSWNISSLALAFLDTSLSVCLSLGSW